MSMTAQYQAAQAAATAGRRWICPRCNKSQPAPDFPALSRKDNQTAVCSPCGTEEAALQWGGHDPWPFDQVHPFTAQPAPRT